VEKKIKSNWKNLLDRLIILQISSDGLEGGENEEICFLFRRLLKGKANQHWRLMEEEDKFNLKIWENVKSWF
jgi:hypothetical protein